MNPLLTEGYAQEREIRSSVAGMCHFSGSGPAGTTCRQCLHWCVPLDMAKQSYRRDEAGS